MASGMEERPREERDNDSRAVSDSRCGGNSDKKAGLSGQGPSLSLPAFPLSRPRFRLPTTPGPLEHITFL